MPGSRYRVHSINPEGEIILFAMDHIQKLRKKNGYVSDKR